MNQILHDNKCKCQAKLLSPKLNTKRKSNNWSDDKVLQYPKLNEIRSKTFQIKYEKILSSNAKFILNSLQNKYIYYAIDDILYLSQLNLIERDNLLAILYSPVIFLQNNFFINFFDIWIREIYIDEIFNNNKFIVNNFKSYKKINFITIKFFYKIRVDLKKQESLW